MPDKREDRGVQGDPRRVAGETPRQSQVDIRRGGEVLSAVESDAEIVEEEPLESPIRRDSDDDWVLATARSGSADALVTGDKDLLVLGGFDGVPILSPRDCLVLLRRAQG